MSAPTVYDVAERSGVSIATVSRVYRTPDSVRAQTRERVLEAARQLGYVPSGNARGLASRTTGVLGLCFPDYADPDAEADAEAEADSDADDAVMLYSDQIIRGMERAARRHGYALLIAASLEGGPESLVAKVAGRVDGFAVLAQTVPTEDLEVISRRLPVVMIAGPREIDHLDHIVVANADGERELARHLIEDHGLRRLAFVGGEVESPDAEARFLGFQQACRDAGLPVPDAPDLRAEMMTQAEGARAAEALLDRDGERPQGVLFANDQMAVGALRALERRGVRVPEDIAVTGFDGIPLSRIVRPPLTTVRQPIRQLGEQAVELLVKRLGNSSSEPVSLMLPVSLIRRASCGCG
ncbi:LacI family DNA-binding transcriptional regulator [Streptomyces sp. NBC_00893]|uniref:LacI family DNA-binding transcriptional regulator n=1 Tax=Streptomyces sp. NBC_00893 TaxID=2975862 RepID=UPI002250D7E1|nr:LacI family DNA-binding transcriptional regulator [Streptomyces sp. NBC_00893]MCX4845504.1 LacI family transcriptional regulator [Streptomyces sp. NBC_00893]